MIDAIRFELCRLFLWAAAAVVPQPYKDKLRNIYRIAKEVARHEAAQH